jgi:hypothetical protein
MNPAETFYPKYDTSCCPVGSTLRERLVIDKHVSCSSSQSHCVAFKGTLKKGTRAILVDLANNAITGIMQPELFEMTSLTALRLNSNDLTGTIPTALGFLAALIQLRLDHNKLSSVIPGLLPLLSKLNIFRLDENPKLCRLNAASTTVTTKCDSECPYPTCPCLKTLFCLSGGTNSGSTATNPASPFYPSEDATCCPVGNTLRERLVLDEHIDCSSGRPCVTETELPSKGVQAVELKLKGQSLSGQILTGSITLELFDMTSLTYLILSNNALTGTMPSELTRLNELNHLYLNGNNLSGPIPDSLTLMKKLVYFQLDTNPGLCRLNAGSEASAGKCDQACPYPTCPCTDWLCPTCAATNLDFLTEVYPESEPSCCVARNSLRERLVADNHFDCSVGSSCLANKLTAGKGTRANQLAYINQSLSATIPTSIGEMTRLTML